MNSHQRRILARALDRRAPYGERAIRRERRKKKRRVVLQDGELMPGFNARITAEFKRAWINAKPFDWGDAKAPTK